MEDRGSVALMLSVFWVWGLPADGEEEAEAWEDKRTKEEECTAISVAELNDILTFAAVRAGASLMPSPTKATMALLVLELGFGGFEVTVAPAFTLAGEEMSED